MSGRNTFWIIGGKGETKGILPAVHSIKSGELLNYYSLNVTKKDNYPQNTQKKMRRELSSKILATPYTATVIF